MKARHILLALALTVATGNAAAQQPSPWHTGALPVPANRIVGLWHVDVTTGPCAGGPRINFFALGNFHAGGTISDANAFPPSTRGPGMGIWRYLGPGPHGIGRYEVRFQFARFLPDGSFDGLQDIGGTIELARNARSYVHDVSARVLNRDGSVRAELCGTALAERVPIQ